jgi:transcriptional regulator with XRE-family HTH domain
MTRKKLLGRHFSEGARRLWLIMRWRAWSQKELAEALGKHTSVINRWLYGERSPDRESALLIHKVLGIAPIAWDQHPAQPFTLPSVLESIGGSA